MTIIGRKDLIPHLQHRQDKRRGKRDPKVSEKYDRREELLSILGYVSYADYLASDQWKAIRSRVLGAQPICILCTRKAEVLHHVKYWDTVLLGLDDTRLAPLCHRCHERIEFSSDGKKVRLTQANLALFKAANITDEGIAWLKAYRSTPGRTRGRT